MNRLRVILMFILGVACLGLITPARAFVVTPAPRVTALPTASPTDGSTLFAPPTDIPRPVIALPNLIGKFTGDQPVNDIVTFVLDLLSLIAGIAAFGYVLFGGFTYMTANGDPGQVDKGRKMIVGAIIGVVIVALAYLLIQYIITDIIGGALGTK